jgi:hypothetical protein
MATEEIQNKTTDLEKAEGDKMGLTFNLIET